MTDPIRPLDVTRHTIPPVTPAARQRRSSDREHEADEREPHGRQHPSQPGPGEDDGLAGGHIDVVA